MGIAELAVVLIVGNFSQQGTDCSLKVVRIRCQVKRVDDHRGGMVTTKDLCSVVNNDTLKNLNINLLLECNYLYLSRKTVKKCRKMSDENRWSPESNGIKLSNEHKIWQASRFLYSEIPHVDVSFFDFGRRSTLTTKRLQKLTEDDLKKNPSCKLSMPADLFVG